MTDQTADNTLMFISEVSERLRTPEATLRYWRHVGKGPKSARIGVRLVYRRADVEAWLHSQFDNTGADK